MAKLKTEWTREAKAQLRQIHDYLKYEKNTPQGAENVKTDLILASKGITYAEQYQKDNINPNYRRIVVKRITNHDLDSNTLTLHSLNEYYEDFDVHLKDVAQIFNILDLRRKKGRR